ncbi:hypothetical protein [Arcobacter roscoffensis]|uniref:Uncharacterized protein n=1 Tax=Arcobacter roscoffensis TaxID=2961520 RepID=A0ABY5E510_9BACT|nr:hypothetical protein [Arcobacter roscoffensis]UTJ06223.1 hypothetical protein NJU99_13360 [Arcobacter roscoffensis]
MDKNELNEARTNPEFLKYLEETRVSSMENKDISAMYETLDSMLVLGLDEEKINSLYEAILITAFENVEKIVNENKKLDLVDNNLLYVRAFYEHAIEKWSYDNFDGAKELVFVLANIIDDEILEQALNVLLVVLAKNISLDDFYETEVNLDMNSSNEKYGYFLVDFKFIPNKFLEENKELLQEQYKKLQPLLDA